MTTKFLDFKTGDESHISTRSNNEIEIDLEKPTQTHKSTAKQKYKARKRDRLVLGRSDGGAEGIDGVRSHEGDGDPSTLASHCSHRHFLFFRLI